MLAADHRVIKQMSTVGGITPLLVGRKANKNMMDNKKLDILAKPGLRSIKENDDGEDEEPAPMPVKKTTKANKALKNMRNFE